MAKAGLRAREIGRGVKVASERAPALRKELQKARKELVKARREVKDPPRRKLPIGAGIAAGAAGAYFFDPKNGSERRSALIEKAQGLMSRKQEGAAQPQPPAEPADVQETTAAGVS
jgi:hypothetical protein